MKRIFLCAVLLFALCASGCSVVTPSVSELLRAPQLSGEYSAIQTALNSVFGSSTQLKYPTQGDFLSPFLFGDWDGNGEEDAAVLFTTSDSTMVRVAILQKNDNGWYVFGVADGLSSEVETVQFATMQEGQANQIVLTFNAEGGHYIAVYAYLEGMLQTIYQAPYEQCIIEDLTGDDCEDLILLSTDVSGEVSIELLTKGEDGFTQTAVPGLSAELFSGYANITASAGSAGRQYLVFDGWISGDNDTLASAMLSFNNETQTFETAELRGTTDLYADSQRYDDDLLSRDIDGDGIIEIPVQPSAQEAGVLNYVQEKRVSFIMWMDFTSASPQKSFGIYDADYNYYIELPWELEGNVLITDGDEDGVIEVRNLAGDQLYFSLRVTAQSGGTSDWRYLTMVDSMRIQIKLETMDEENTIESLNMSHFYSAVYVLN